MLLTELCWGLSWGSALNLNYVNSSIDLFSGTFFEWSFSFTYTLLKGDPKETDILLISLKLFFKVEATFPSGLFFIFLAEKILSVNLLLHPPRTEGVSPVTSLDLLRMESAWFGMLSMILNDLSGEGYLVLDMTLTGFTWENLGFGWYIKFYEEICFVFLL